MTAAFVGMALAVLATLPVSWLISTTLAEQALHIHIPLMWSATGVAVCLGSAAIVTVIATTLPVWRNLRQPVRNALAFE